MSIGNINNGESGLSARDKINLTIDTVNGLPFEYWTGGTGTNSVKANNGTANTAAGQNALSVGDLTIASAINTFAANYNTTASGNEASAFGYQTSATGFHSFSMGAWNTAAGNQTLAANVASTSANWASAFGYGSNAQGGGSIAGGINAFAQGEPSFAFGNRAYGVSNYSVAFGTGTVADGVGSFVGGTSLGETTNRVRAGGNTSFAFFRKNTVAGDTGTVADYSVILGGVEQVIDAGANSSVILGGSGNTISTNTNDSVLLGMTDYTASLPNTVYVPNFVITQSYTPASSGDTVGTIGSTTWDNNYMYIKTNTGWGRINLDYVF